MLFIVKIQDPRMMPRLLLSLLSGIALATSDAAMTPTEQLALYWEIQTSNIEQSDSIRQLSSEKDWESQKSEARAQLADMLGLNPTPAKTPLNPRKTGEFSGDGFKVETLVFESMPKLYVTANLYLPISQKEQAPAILYVCGHSVMKKDGVSFGNKTGYHHHGVWFARHGYVCLTVDTLQLGEIEGEHHGTHHLGKWWWQARGYTPAGVEAWNGIRALDYLQTRTEVDASRMGVTGRSGGGATSWWVAALDERIRAAAPTAGITNLRDHLVGNCIDGHCDCMFFVNTYRWDFDKVAALVAPRPLLVCNTDKDPIFPLDGVVDVFRKVRGVYAQLNASKHLGLQIAEGPHKDVQPLNTGAFHWFERHLKGADPMATTSDAAVKVLQPEQLRVLTSTPAGQINTAIDSSFVPAAAAAPPPKNLGEWEAMRESWMNDLNSHVFAAWPAIAAKAPREIGSTSHGDGMLHAYSCEGEEPFELRLYAFIPKGSEPLLHAEGVRLQILDETTWKSFERAHRNALKKIGDPFIDLLEVDSSQSSEDVGEAVHSKRPVIYAVPRGIGPLAWKQPKDVSIRRRFALLGSTVEGSQTWDICTLTEAARALAKFRGAKFHLHASKAMAVNAMYASLFIEPPASVTLTSPTCTHADGPIYLNVLRFLDCPQAAALSAARQSIRFVGADPEQWVWTTRAAAGIGLADRVIFNTR
jgi:hypothetical protein